MAAGIALARSREQREALLFGESHHVGEQIHWRCRQRRGGARHGASGIQRRGLIGRRRLDAASFDRRPRPAAPIRSDAVTVRRGNASALRPVRLPQLRRAVGRSAGSRPPPVHRAGGRIPPPSTDVRVGAIRRARGIGGCRSIVEGIGRVPLPAARVRQDSRLRAGRCACLQRPALRSRRLDFAREVRCEGLDAGVDDLASIPGFAAAGEFACRRGGARSSTIRCRRGGLIARAVSRSPSTSTIVRVRCAVRSGIAHTARISPHSRRSGRRTVCRARA